MTCRSAESSAAGPRHTRSSLWRDARGVTQTEYLVLFVMIVVGTVGAWVAFGKDLADVFVEQSEPTNAAANAYVERNLLGRFGGPARSPGAGMDDLADAVDPRSWADSAWDAAKGVAGEVVSLPGAVADEARAAATSAYEQGKDTLSNLPQTAASAAGQALGDSFAGASPSGGSPVSPVNAIVGNGPPGGGSPGGGSPGGGSPGGGSPGTTGSANPSSGAPQLGSRVPPPSSPAAFPNVQRAKPKTSVQGGGGKRKRWKDDKGNIYEWDSQHGTVEKYNKNGKHMGEFDPDTGEMLKPADPTRRVEP